MAGTSDNRRYLAGHMERRQVELGLTWKQIADAGGISYEAVRAVRHGTADIRAQTRHGIDTGLRWTPGSVDRILSGGDPEPLPAARPAPVREVTLADTGSVHDLMLRVLTDDLERMIWETTSLSEDERLHEIRELRATRARLAAGEQGHGSGTGLAAAVT